MTTKTLTAALGAIALSATAVSAFADTVTTNGVTWTYTVTDASAKTVTLGAGGSGNQCMPTATEINAKYIPWTFIGESDGETYTVTKVNDYAFDGCKGLTGTLVIPNAVTEIRGRAFQNCKGLTGLEFGSGLTTIRQYAFNESEIGCELPDLSRITTFEQGVFQSTFMTGKVKLNQSLSTVVRRLFYNTYISGSVVIPETVTEVRDESFRNCKYLEAAWIKGRPTVSSGTQNYTGCLTTNMFANCEIIKLLVMGPNTRPKAGWGVTKQWEGFCKTDKDAVIFFPDNGYWDGFSLNNSANATIVYYGAGQDLDLAFDNVAGKVTAYPKTAASLELVLNNASKFKDYFGLDTKVAVTNTLSSPVTVSAEDLQNVTFVTYVTFAVNTQAQLDATLAALPAAMPIVIDATGATETINVPAGRNVAVLVPGGGKYGPQTNGLTITFY